MVTMNANDGARALRFRCISPDQAADLLLRRFAGSLPALAVFDTRERAYFERGHIDTAQWLNDSSFGAALQRVSRSTPVLIYCHHGHASQAWAERFTDFRYAEVYSVDGGHDRLLDALNARAGDAGAPALPPDASVALETFLAEHDFDTRDLNRARAHGLTPLMRAALSGEAALVDELLALDVAANARNGDGNNALWLACVAGDAGIVRALIAAGIDIDNCNDTGATALMYTASSGKHDMLALLLGYGADATLRTGDDYMAVDLAATEACLRLLRHTAR
jgi:uncharacterized protein